MSQRLSRSQRESIIIDYLNGKETPGYKVTENANGKFTVKRIKEVPNPIESEAKPKFEIEEEDANESESETKPNSKDDSDDDFQSLKQPPKQRSKQDARELLRQLSQLLNEDEEDQKELKTPKEYQYLEKRHPSWTTNWQRKKLILN